MRTRVREKNTPQVQESSNGRKFVIYFGAYSLISVMLLIPLVGIKNSDFFIYNLGMLGLSLLGAIVSVYMSHISQFLLSIISVFSGSNTGLFLEFLQEISKKKTDKNSIKKVDYNEKQVYEFLKIVVFGLFFPFVSIIIFLGQAEMSGGINLGEGCILFFMPIFWILFYRKVILNKTSPYTFVYTPIKKQEISITSNLSHHNKYYQNQERMKQAEKSVKKHINHKKYIKSAIVSTVFSFFCIMLFSIFLLINTLEGGGAIVSTGTLYLVGIVMSWITSYIYQIQEIKKLYNSKEISLYFLSIGEGKYNFQEVENDSFVFSKK